MEYLISKCAVAFVAAVYGNPAVATHLSSNFRPRPVAALFAGQPGRPSCAGESKEHLISPAAWAAVRVRESARHAQFLRLKARRGAKKAILAAAAMLMAA
ncbi:hypothetical protein [Cupriavidus necator]